MQNLGGDFLERFEVVVDQNAGPADWDDVLADFLVAYVRRGRLVATEASTTDEATRTEADERQTGTVAK